MAEKLSMTDLRRAVMARTGATEKEITTFLNALSEQIVEALRNDESVKINGLGTFRLQAIAPRKSVNIATGESITIGGYNKLTFTPEVSIKELVGNNPLPAETVASKSDTSTVKAQTPKKQTDSEFDPMKKLGEQADEIVDILATLGQGPKAGKITPASEEESTPKAEPAPSPTPQIEKTVAEEPTIEPIKPIEPIEPIKPIEHIEHIEHIEPIVPPKSETPQKPKKKYHFLRDTLICVCCLLIVLAGGFFFLRESLSQWVDSLRTQPTTEKIQPIDTIATSVNTIATADTIQPIDTIESSNAIAQPTQPNELVYSEFIGTERVRVGSRLAQIARRHYGENKMDLWVFIYDANKDQIDNPNEIKVGTELRIPKLTNQQMDLTDPDTQALIKHLKEQANSYRK